MIKKFSKYLPEILPKTIDIKNPTQVLVQRVQLIRSPKNLDFFLIHSLEDSKIEPQTNIEVIP
jgi:hypothetical protein